MLLAKMTTVQCSAMLFDLDGVLVDSTPAVARVWTRWALAHGLDPEWVVHRAHGRPSRETVRELLPNSDYEAQNQIVLRGEIKDTEGVVPLPGTEQLLNSLPSDRWTIVTSCSRPLAEVRLRAAGLPIPPKMVTSNDVANGKPDPEPYLKGAAMLGIPASGCIVVEDAPAGIVAGKSAGARVIGFPTTMNPAELSQAGADWLVKNCAAIGASNHGAGLTLALALL